VEGEGGLGTPVDIVVVVMVVWFVGLKEEVKENEGK